MAAPTNREFDIRGVNHLALVCKDMAKTVEFYRDVLGMPLIKTIDLPGGRGQHFFFDIGNGDSLAFFWFPNAPTKAPGVASPEGVPGIGGEIVTAHASMNHVAFDVPADRSVDGVTRARWRHRLVQEAIDLARSDVLDEIGLVLGRAGHDQHQVGKLDA